MLLSLGLHGTALLLMFALSSSQAQKERLIVIDFDLAEPGNPATPSTTCSAKKAKTTVMAKTLPSPSPPKQKSAPTKPAAEPARMAPEFAKPGESIRPPAEQSSSTTATTMNGGSGTPGSNQTGGNSGTGDSGEKLAGKYRAEHFAYIKQIIEQNISYPKRAQRMGWSGRVVVSFDVLKNGHVQDIRIVKSSGYEILDSNLVETIRKAEPFPRPPVSVTLNMPITYQLR